MNGRTDTEALRALSSDYRLGQLGDHVSSLSLFRAFRLDRDEVVHSRLLAMLLDQDRHRGAEVMLRVLLRAVLDSGRLEGGVAERLGKVVRGPWERVSVRREFLLIDVVILITTSQGKAVVGIENKIDAGEQHEQIARYQDTLQRVFPDRAAVVVFLTPTGREPNTASLDSPVPALALSYETVLAAVEEARRHADPGGRDGSVLDEIAAHLKEDIVGDPELKAMVRELWRTHRKALGLAVTHHPRLSDIRDLYVRLLTERFGQDIDIYYYPERRRNLREIKMDLPQWFEWGFPFTFMLHANDWGRPRVRALIWRDNYTPHARSLQEWARHVNASVGPIIDEDFTPVSGWGGWHRVFREEDYPESAVLDEVVFDEKTALAALEAVSVLVEQLRPHIEGK